MARTTCQNLRMSGRRPRACGYPVDRFIRTVAFNPVKGALEELFLCPNCTQDYLEVIAMFFHNAEEIPWPRDKPIAGPDGIIVRNSGVRKILKALGVDVNGSRGVISEKDRRIFQQIPPDELRRRIEEDPDLLDQVLSRAPVTEPADLAQD